MTDNLVNAIICGDCLEVLQQVPPDSVDLTVIDPPYCSRNKARTGSRYKQSIYATKFDDMSERAFLRFMTERLSCIYDRMKLEAHIYVFSGWQYLRGIMDCLEDASFKLNKVLVWDQCSLGGGYSWRNQHEFIVFASKGIPRPTNSKSLTTVLSYPRVRKPLHPFEKPEGLIRDLVENASQVGDLVLDGFLGSGTTAVVSQRLDRRWLGIEVSPEYCEVARQRLERPLLERLDEIGLK